MLKISEAIEIDAAPDRVWTALADIDRVVPCIPGAELGEEIEPGTYTGRLTMAFGPIRATFNGRVGVKVDAAARTGEIEGRGVDAKQRNRTKATAEIRQTSPEGTDHTSLVVDAQVEVSGPLSQFVNTGGAKLAQAVLADFGSALSSQLAAEATPDQTDVEPVQVQRKEIRPVRMMLSSIADYFKRLFRRKPADRNAPDN